MTFQVETFSLRFDSDAENQIKDLDSSSKRKCALCGKEFKKTGKKKICTREHYRICPICHQQFSVNKYLDRGISGIPTTCSKECKKKLQSQITKDPSVKAKREKTNLERYGVSNTSHNDEIKSRISSSLKSKVRTQTCVVCGKVFELKSGQYKKCCSEECLHELQHENNLKRSIKSGRHQDDLERAERVKRDRELRYTNSSQRPEVRAKIAEARLGTHFKHSDETKLKIKEALSRAYQDQNRKEEINAKRISTVRQRYGVDNVFQSDEVKEKITQTSNLRYGVNHPSQNSSIKDVTKQSRQKTFQSRYGATHPMQVDEFKNKRLETIFNRANSKDCSNLDKYHVSSKNRQFKELLQAHRVECEYEFPLGGKQFDLCIPDSKTLIEIDPSYSHAYAGTNLATNDKNSQLKKTEVAANNGYRCIHVFDWDNLDKVLALVLPKLKLGARQCNVKQIDKSTADEFTEKNHIQGKCRGQILSFGLYFEGALVEVLTFGKSRYSKKFKWELLRLCTKSDTRVLGGASKLFKFAIQTHTDLDGIISYCDRSKFTGEVYQKIGMNLLRITKPHEIWSKNSEYITANMLQSHGFDQIFGTSYGKGSSNSSLMLQAGWLPVYDCGQLVFSWNRL